MRKRQILMLLIAIWLAIIIPAAAQEEMPVIVDPPWVSMSVFTNWQEIQLTYTVRWLDGYKPLFDEAKPENMFFAPFELDPVRGYKLGLQNRRKYKKENYVDLIYYLRHISDKKGDIIIPEQVFRYIKEEAGKSREGLEVYEVKAPGIILRYDSVLTKNADDIIDRVDFGSFKGQENLWNGLIGGLVLIMGVILFLLFRTPAVSVARKIGKTKAVSIGQAINEQEERFVPKYALIFLGHNLIRLQASLADNLDDQKLHKTRTAICNELRRFFLSYVPYLGVSEFSYEEIRAKILQMPEKRKRELLIILTGWLEYHENILYHEETKGGLVDEIITIRKHAGDLDGLKIWLFNIRQRKQRLVTRFTKLFRRAK